MRATEIAKRVGSRVAIALLAGAAFGCADASFGISSPGGSVPGAEFRLVVPAVSSDQSSQRMHLEDEAGNELIIAEAAVVIRDPQLAPTDVETCPDPDPDAEEFECEPFYIGTSRLVLPVVEEVTSVQVTAVEAGAYDRLQFDLHVPDATDPDDNEFLASRPELDGVSVQVSGTYNDDNFEISVGADGGETILSLDSPVTIEEGVRAPIDLRFDVQDWFRDADGLLIDPHSADEGEENAELVQQNILNSLSLSSP